MSALEQPSLTAPTGGFGDPGVATSAPPSDMPSGSISWCCGTTAWWTPLPATAGDSISAISVQVGDNGSLNGAVTGGSGGNNVMVSLFAQPTAGGTATPIGPVTAYATSDGRGHVQTLSFTLSPAYQVPSGVIVQLRALASSGYPITPTRPSSIGPVTVTPAAPQSPPATIFIETGSPTLNSTFKPVGILLNGAWEVHLPPQVVGNVLPDLTAWVTDNPLRNTLARLSLFSDTSSASVELGDVFSNGSGIRQLLTIPGGHVVAAGESFRAILSTFGGSISDPPSVSFEIVHLGAF